LVLTVICNPTFRLPSREQPRSRSCLPYSDIGDLPKLRPKRFKGSDYAHAVHELNKVIDRAEALLP